jgi:hypothetical protein
MSRQQREAAADLAKQNESDDAKVNIKKSAHIIFMWVENDPDPLMRKAERFMLENWQVNGGIQSRWSAGSLIYTLTMTISG